ncbi:M56 family metallopeptidase [Anaerorhabdus sp.]|uniref:M56 family metallopeptidase n=1 Tax=Anaerorhabdus sp. TaxID=1872524 RepID=UPI002FC6BB9C
MNFIFFNLIFYNIISSIVYIVLHFFAEKQFWIYPKYVIIMIKYTVLFFITPFWILLLATYISLNSQINVFVSGMEDTNNILIMSNFSLNQLFSRDFYWVTIIVIIIWFLGFVIIAIKKLREKKAILHFLKIHMEQDEKLSKLFNEISEQLSIKKKINVYLCPYVPSPCLIKYKDYIILTPTLGESSDDTYYFLLHEAFHFKSHDLIYLKVIEFLETMFWFNPFINKLYTLYSSFAEIVCDEKIVSSNENVKLNYMLAIKNALMHSIRIKNEYPTMNLIDKNHSELIKRINYMMNFKYNLKTKILSIILMLSFFLFMPLTTYAGTVILNKSTGFAINQIRETTYEIIENEIETIDINYLDEELYVNKLSPSKFMIMPKGYNSIDISLYKLEKNYLYNIKLTSSENLSVNLSSSLNATFKFLVCREGSSSCKTVNSSNGRINQDLTGFDGSNYSIYIENTYNSSNTIRGYIENYTKKMQ